MQVERAAALVFEGRELKTPTVVRAKLLVDAIMPGCGDRFKMWSEELSDGNWDLHFATHCKACQEMAERVTIDAFGNLKVTIKELTQKEREFNAKFKRPSG